MLSKLSKFIADWSHLTPIVVNNFRKNHPNETILIYGACKAHRNDDEEGISGVGWGLSRRSTLILTEKRLVCRDWEILLDKVKYAEAIMFGSGMILKIADASGAHYQFALQKDPKWLTQSVLSIKLSDEPVKYGGYVKFVRVAVYAGLALWIASHFTDMF